MSDPTGSPAEGPKAPAAAGAAVVATPPARAPTARLLYLRDFVYGGIDGAVTTFAIVAGVVGAALEPAVILILGFANLVADGFSMAAM